MRCKLQSQGSRCNHAATLCNHCDATATTRLMLQSCCNHCDFTCFLLFMQAGPHHITHDRESVLSHCLQRHAESEVSRPTFQHQQGSNLSWGREKHTLARSAASMTCSLAWSQSGRRAAGCRRWCRRPSLAASSGELASPIISTIAALSDDPATWQR